MFELSTEWYKQHEGTQYLENTVTTYEELLKNRIGETVRVYSMTLDGRNVSIVHDEGVLDSVKREEHNTKGLIQLRIKLTFEPNNPDFTPLGSAKHWDYLYMPNFVKFAVDEDKDPYRALEVKQWKEKKRVERIERNKYEQWLENEQDKIVLARWNGMSWSKLKENYYQFSRQTYEFTMITSTPNFRRYTESFTSTTLVRVMCRVFKEQGITLLDIEKRARTDETAEDYLNRYFKLFHYTKHGGSKVYDGCRVIQFLQKES